MGYLNQEKRKKYFAQSIMKLLDKNYSQNILNLIYCGILYSYEDSMKDLEMAKQYFSNAGTMLETLPGDDKFKIEVKYIFTLFRGFDLYSHGQIPEALEYSRTGSIKKRRCYCQILSGIGRCRAS